MPEYCFQFQVSREDYLRFYKGTASVIIARTDDGTRVQFPASAMREYVSADGIHGRFRLRTDDNNKLLSLERIV